MLITFIAWCLITWFAFCVGTVSVQFWHKVSRQRGNVRSPLDETLLMGICMLTVYAEFFSLFYRVAIEAFLLLTMFCLFMSWRNWKEYRQIFQELIKIKKQFLLGAAVVLIIMLLVGASGDSLYDTGLYHAQMIRWTEEYGAVKGLGCLYHRFAFNSAFLVLQSLFSFGYLFGQELYSLNAYLAFLLVLWALSTFKLWKEKTVSLSDMGRLLFFIFLITMKNRIDSPGTDFFAIALTIYVMTKWFVLIEERCEDVRPYLFLCFFAVYAVTLKLSAAVIVLLSLYPLYMLIRRKEYRLLCISLAIGLAIAVPFLIRNVLLSGYLLYPFPAVDLFSVDWKMPIEEVIADKIEITGWARGLRGQEQYAYPFAQWFPIWWDTLGILNKICFIFFFPSFAVMLIRCVHVGLSSRVQQEKIGIVHLYFVEAMLVLLWFVSAPDLRFGGVFLLLVPFTLAGELLAQCKWKIVTVGTASLTILFVSFIMMRYILTEEIYVITPAPYSYYEVKSCKLSGVTFYYPAEGDQVGYYHFPSTPYGKRITENMIELRNIEKGIGEGFRMKR